MPYRSAAQRRKFHAMLARGEIRPEVVEEFDRASRGRRLPERVSKGLIMPRKRKSVKRRARTTRWRDPVAAAPATATSRHRRKPAKKRKPARRRAAKGFSLRDFLGLGTATSRTRRKPAKRKSAKRKTAKRKTRRDWPGQSRRHATAAKKGWRTGHKKVKAKAKTKGRRDPAKAAMIRHYELERKAALKYGRKSDAADYARRVRSLRGR